MLNSSGTALIVGIPKVVIRFTLFQGVKKSDTLRLRQSAALQRLN
jgi:hypothetical protein